jgi:MoxR-like ATPase
LKEEKIYLEQNLEELRKKEIAREETLREINNKTSKTIESHRRELIGLKLDLDILDGRSSDDQFEVKTYEKPKSYKTLKSENKTDQLIDVSKIVHSRMENQGFNYSIEYVSKLLIATCQNLVVTLSGKPGSGKTTAASALAKGLGLTDKDKHIHIQVQRGWTSDKDLLGFQNRLTNTYEPDRYGFYALLKKLQVADSEDSMSLVTLDEANLSPMEYYFSTFMGSFDDKSKFFTQGDNIKLPPGLRFIATVNNDRTTELLSERFLDRSPVIISKPIGNDDYEVPYEPNLREYEEFNFDQLIQIMTPENTIDLFDNNERKIIQTISDEHKILSIEKRKIKALSAFTGVGRELFQSFSSDNDLKALDEAFLMFLLPKISGQGQKYKENLDRLSDYLEKQGLMESSEIIKSIIRNSQYETYSFF